MNQNRSTKIDIYKLVLIGLLIFFTRLPWLGAGYGDDPDSWRVANTGRAISNCEQYKASRLPGYPINEYVCSILIKGGPIATNFASACFSLLAFYAFYSILRRFQIPYSTLVAAAFALTPVIYINSTCTIDYIWALSFSLMSFAFVVRQRPVMGGISLGLAIGCRITSGAMIVPLLLYLWMGYKGKQRYKYTLIFMTISLITGFVCFIPVLNRYGLGFLTFSEHSSYPPIIEVIYWFTVGVWGCLGSFLIVLLLGTLPIYWKHFKTEILNYNNRFVLIICSVALLLYIVAFLRLPYNSGYLVPIVPFLLLFAGVCIPRKVLVALCIGLLVSSFVVHVKLSGFSLAGPIFHDHWKRRNSIIIVDNIISQVQEISHKAVVVVGTMLPIIEWKLGSNIRGTKKYVYMLTKYELDKYQAQGYKLYYVEGQDKYSWQRHSVDLSKKGAQILTITE